MVGRLGGREGAREEGRTESMPLRGSDVGLVSASIRRSAIGEGCQVRPRDLLSRTSIHPIDVVFLFKVVEVLSHSSSSSSSSSSRSSSFLLSLVKESFFFSLLRLRLYLSREKKNHSLGRDPR